MKNKALLKVVAILAILGAIPTQIIFRNLSPVSANESLLIAQAQESLFSVALRWARRNASRPDLVELRRTRTAGDYALVTGQYGEMGGQILLKEESGQWKVVTGGGGSLQNAEYLMQLGVPSEAAQRLEDGPDI